MKDNLTQIAIELKKYGYDQRLSWGDSYLIIKTKEYVRFIGQEINDEYIRVPLLANLFTNLSKTNFTLEQKVIGESNGEKVCEFTARIADKEIKSDNIWAVLAKLWILSKSL